MTGPGWPQHPSDQPSDDPSATGPAEWLRRQLLERRVVGLLGTLDDRCATEVAAALMTLDATGDSAVELQIDSANGTVDAAMALMDVIDLLGVPVHAWCSGRAGGPAVGVLAVCGSRVASPHARIQLTEPQVHFDGDARAVGQQAEEHLRRWAAFCRRLSEATGQTLQQVSDDTARGRFLSAAEAVDYGILDSVAGPDARIIRLPGRPFGFQPR
jgi:ATP-dependent Clp protease protease subunit